MYGSGNNPMYVGKAKSLCNRIQSYYSGEQDPKTSTLLSHVTEIEYITTKNEKEALLLEYTLIKKYSPKYNILFRDDKRYQAVAITSDAYPSIKIIRSDQQTKYQAVFGPYPRAEIAKQMISLAQKKFKLRSCSPSEFAGRARPCVWYDIEQCTAPCVSLVTEKSYQKQVEQATAFFTNNHAERSSIIQKIEQYAESQEYEKAIQYRTLLQSLDNRVEDTATAPTYQRDIIAIVAMNATYCFYYLALRNYITVSDKTIVRSKSAFSTENEFITSGIIALLKDAPFYPNMNIELIYPLDTTDGLQEAIIALYSTSVSIIKHTPPQISTDQLDFQLNLAMRSAFQGLKLYESPASMLNALHGQFKQWDDAKTIEAIDASHWEGRGALVGFIHFNAHGFLKSRYRTYLIEKNSQDDLEMFAIAIKRHLAALDKKSEQFPDIFIVDGGKTHWHVMNTILSGFEKGKRANVIAISKGQSRKPSQYQAHFVSSSNNQILESIPAQNLPPLVLKLFQNLTDEAHRFANTRSSQNRSKKQFESVLLEIAGIGVKKRLSLYKYFGSLEAIKKASISSLVMAPGISKQNADSIYNTFHNQTK